MSTQEFRQKVLADVEYIDQVLPVLEARKAELDAERERYETVIADARAMRNRAEGILEQLGEEWRQ